MHDGLCQISIMIEGSKHNFRNFTSCESHERNDNHVYQFMLNELEPLVQEMASARFKGRIPKETEESDRQLCQCILKCYSVMLQILISSNRTGQSEVSGLWCNTIEL